jgi:transcriptional regulator GlxA family with amidase domain
MCSQTPVCGLLKLRAVDPGVATVIDIMWRGTESPLSIQRLSQSVNLTPGRLRQLFKMETGLSPLQYLRRVRLQRAASLLSTSFLSVKEVTFRSGGGDVSNFVRDFKRQYGMTPSEFRAQSRSLSKIPPLAGGGSE